MRAPDHESYVERKIRQAIERGEFDNIDGSGEPLEILKEPYESSWWVRRWVKRETLKDALRRQAEPGD